MGSARPGSVRCTYCGARGQAGAVVEADLRGLRYDYCDAACATAHRQAVELTAALCTGCDEGAAGDTGACAEHLEVEVEVAAAPEITWRRAG